MKHVSVWSSLAFLTLAFVETAPAQALLGVTGTGDVYEVDAFTGSGTLVGPSGFSSLDALVSTGCVIYSVSGSTLLSIDTGTGVGTALGTIPLVAVRAMSLNTADGLIYAVEDGGDPMSRDVLYTIDPTTRSTQKIGSLGYNGIVGLAFRGTQLYAWDTGAGTGAGLLRVDTMTGVTSDVNPNVGGSAVSEQFLAYHQQSQSLITGRDALYRVATNGVTTLVGSGGYADLRGLDSFGFGFVHGYCFQSKTNTCGKTPGTIWQFTGAILTGFGATDAYFGSFGVLIYSPNGPANIPFAGGALCINPLGRRTSHPIAATGGSPMNPCDAQFVIDLKAYAAGTLGGNPAPFLKTPGQRVHMQWWSHDPQPQLSYLSPAIGYNVCN